MYCVSEEPDGGDAGQPGAAGGARQGDAGPGHQPPPAGHRGAPPRAAHRLPAPVQTRQCKGTVSGVTYRGSTRASRSWNPSFLRYTSALWHFPPIPALN